MSNLGFSRFVFSDEVTEGINPSRLWNTRNVPAPGERTAGAPAADTRFDGEPLYEGDVGTLWGYCLVDGRAAVLSCSTAAEALEVPTFLGGCPVRIIAPRAFSNMASLRRIALPDGVEEICDFAFMFSGLERFDAPARLKSIGARAFFSCLQLEEIRLNEGLLSIGREALSMTRVAALELPASVCEIGHEALSGARIEFGCEGRSLRIAEGSPFSLDEDGGLYRRFDDGLLMVRLLCREVGDYRVAEGCVAIGRHAFAGHEALQHVMLPEGLQLIQDAAFSGCPRLSLVELPSTLEAIGIGAFKNCALRSLRLPAALGAVGYDAFVNTLRDVYVEPYIQSIEVEPGNKRLYVVDDMLCLRDAVADGDAVMLYFGRGGTVAIPEQVTAIGPSAFAGQTRVNRLVLHDHLSYVDGHGFFFEGGLGEVVYRGAGPDGSDVTVRFPMSSGGTTAARGAFRKGGADARVAMQQADNALFGAANVQERYVLMGKRLREPLWLDDETHRQIADTLRQHLSSVCVAYAKNNFLEGFDALTQEDILNSDTFEAAFEAVSEAGDVIAVNRLLEIRRSLCSNAFDFDL